MLSVLCFSVLQEYVSPPHKPSNSLFFLYFDPPIEKQFVVDVLFKFEKKNGRDSLASTLIQFISAWVEVPLTRRSTF